MSSRRWFGPSLGLVLALFGACGDGASEQPQDAGIDAPDADMSECGSKPDGTACGNLADSACDRADTCQGGMCVQNFAAANTACGDAAVTECDLADTCDGAGACVPNHVAASTACGDPAVTECDLADTCDGAGACAPNHVAANTACGDAGATDCDLADSCDGAGACGANLAAEGTACYDCAAGPGQCAECTAANTCDDGPACVEGTDTPIASTFTGGNGHRGNMFDITAVNDIVITSFDAHPAGNTTIAIYYKVGTYAGSEATSAAWTLIGSAAVTAQPLGTATPVPVPVNVTIPAGATYAFYVTSTSTDASASLNYTDGNMEGAVFTSDTNLQLRQGVGLGYPFTNGGEVFRPRVWNGVIHYYRVLPDATLSSRGGTYSGGSSYGVMFDVVASLDLRLRDQLDVELTAGTHTVDVYFRRGSFVGYETSVAGWERIGGASSIMSLGDGSVSALPLLDEIHLSAGETIGIYVDTGITTAGLRTDAGGNVGDTAASNSALTVEVGRANAGMFGTAGAATTVRGVLAYPVCVVQP